MAKHVDTTRPEDAPGIPWYPEDIRGAQHRKPGEATEGLHYYPDVWSGDPDTDKAWRPHMGVTTGHWG